MNQSELEVNVTGVKRGKTRASKTRLVLVLFLISWKIGASFANQSQSEVKQNHSDCQIVFDSQLKTALTIGIPPVKGFLFAL